MVIVSSTVEAYELMPHQCFNIRRLGVNHSYYGLTLALVLPVNQEQVRKYLNVVEYQRIGFVVLSGRRFRRLELHLAYELHTIVGVVSAACCESEYSVIHIANVVPHSAFICIFQYLIDKVDARFGCRMILLIEIPLDHCP
jgi:hypothetical protein